MRLKILILLSINFSIWSISAYTQESKIDKLLDRIEIGTSLEIGPETGISALFPKVEIYLYEPFTRNIYFSSNISLWGFIQTFFSIGAGMGIRYESISCELTYSFFYLPEIMKTYQYSSWSTLNPKIGLFIKPLWLKFGPSMVLNKNGREVDLINMTKIGDIRFNYEIQLLLGEL